MSRLRRAAPICALAAVTAAGVGSSPGADAPPAGPIRFQDLSAVSGGPVDFGYPTSTVEKATGGFLDADGDGWDDLVTLTGMNQPFGYFLNRPDGSGGRRYVPAPAGSGLDSGAAYDRDGAALCVGDVDADGDVDLYVGCGFNSAAEVEASGQGPIDAIPAGRGASLLFLNDGSGNFTDVAAAVGLVPETEPYTDWNGDGAYDVTLNEPYTDTNLNGVHDGDEPFTDWNGNGRQDDRLSEPFTDLNGNGFRDVSDSTTCGAVFFDMDLDGDLDLLSCNTRFGPFGKSGDGVPHLYRNELAETGVLRFVDEAAARGIVEPRRKDRSRIDFYGVWAVSGVDYDGDGDFDVLISHDIGGETQLFRNDGTGHFEDVTKSAGSGKGDDRNPSTFGDDSASAMGIAWGDVENDGDLDLYLSDVAGDPATSEFGNPLYVNNGDGTFTLLAKAAGVKAGWVTWGTTFADFDLDGWVDLYVGGGDLWNMDRSVVRSWLYRNDRDGTFTEVLEGSGIRHDDPFHRENGSASADFDGDGRPDLLVTRAHRFAPASPYLYRNVTETPGRRWLAATLRGDGVRSNTSAIGARVRVIPKDAGGAALPGLVQLREVQSADSRNATSSLTQHVGLGPDAVLADVEVRWPRAGTVEERTVLYRDVPLDRRVTITEAPRTGVWRPDPEHEVAVADGVPHEVTCVGAGEPDPLTTLSVETGPAWVTRGPWQDGPTVLIAPPRVESVESFDATLLAVAQGAEDPESRQTLRVRVVPAPRVARARLLSKREVRLDGDHLDLAGLVVTIDGTECVVRSSKALKPKAGVPRSKAVVTVPKSLRRALGKGHHEVRVVEPEAGFEATAVLSR